MFFALLIALHLVLVKSDTKNASLKTNHEDHARVEKVNNLTNTSSTKTETTTIGNNTSSNGKLQDWKSFCKDNDCSHCGCSFKYGYSDKIGCQCLEECETTTKIKDKRGIQDWNWKKFCKDGWNSKKCKDFMNSHGMMKEDGWVRAVKSLGDQKADWNYYDDDHMNQEYEDREKIENLNITEIYCGCFKDHDKPNDSDESDASDSSDYGSKNENGIVPHDGLSYDDYVEYGPEQPNAKPKCSDPRRVLLHTLHASPKLDTMTNWCRDEDYKTSADPEKEICGCSYLWLAIPKGSKINHIAGEGDCQCLKVPENTTMASHNKGSLWFPKYHKAWENACTRGWTRKRCTKFMGSHGISLNQKHVKYNSIHSPRVQFFQGNNYEVKIDKIHLCGCSKDHSFGKCYRYN